MSLQKKYLSSHKNKSIVLRVKILSNAQANKIIIIIQMVVVFFINAVVNPFVIRITEAMKKPEQNRFNTFYWKMRAAKIETMPIISESNFDSFVNISRTE